jgi:divalent metal cation (Fe/Co/Zn/Cd) transporter
MSESTPANPTFRAFRKAAFVLVLIGLAWNLLELVVALWAGFRAGSVALLGFGFDSFVELFAGGVLVWRLGSEWSDEREENEAEQRALHLVGITFYVLAAYIVGHSLLTLFGFAPRPAESLVGIVLVIASAVVMTILYFWKLSISKKIGSRALHAEATESLVCDIQDLTLLVGLGLNALVGWWWADPMAALLLVPWLVKEGREALSGEHDHD